MCPGSTDNLYIDRQSSAAIEATIKALSHSLWSKEIPGDVDIKSDDLAARRDWPGCKCFEAARAVYTYALRTRSACPDDQSQLLFHNQSVGPSNL